MKTVQKLSMGSSIVTVLSAWAIVFAQAPEPPVGDLTITAAFDKIVALSADREYEKMLPYCRAIVDKAAAKEALTADESYALGWAHLYLAASAFGRGLADGNLRAQWQEAAKKWQEQIRPKPKQQPQEGELVVINAVAEIEGHTKDPAVATIAIPHRLFLEQFPTMTLKLLKGWVEEGHRLWLCNDVAEAFGATVGQPWGGPVGHEDAMATVKVPTGSHPLITGVARVRVIGKTELAGQMKADGSTLKVAVVGSRDWVLLGSQQTIQIADLGYTKHYVAFAASARRGRGELLFIYPGLDYTKYDGPVFKRNLDRYVLTFPNWREKGE